MMASQHLHDALPCRDSPVECYTLCRLKLNHLNISYHDDMPCLCLSLCLCLLQPMPGYKPAVRDWSEYWPGEDNPQIIFENGENGLSSVHTRYDPACKHPHSSPHLSLHKTHIDTPSCMQALSWAPGRTSHTMRSVMPRAAPMA